MAASNEAVKRADVIFVEAPTTMEQVEKLPKLIPGPLLYNWVWKGKSPLVPREALGFSMRRCPVALAARRPAP